jgi:hypothetical protein
VGIIGRYRQAADRYMDNRNAAPAPAPEPPMSTLGRYRQAADRYMNNLDAAAPAPRTPLRTNQHILHLLLSIVTGGLWLPVWFIRAWRGNPAPPADPAGCAGLTPAPGSPEPGGEGERWMSR